MRNQQASTRYFRSLVAVMAALMALVLAATPAGAQIVHGQRPQVTQGLTYLSWELSGDTDLTVRQWYVPLSVRAGLTENVELAVYSAAARSSANWERQDNSVGGLGDSKIQLSASFLDDQLLASAGVSLPTGKTKLNTDEQALLSWVTSGFLNFPIKTPGEGTNLFGQIGAAVPLGSSQWVFGASAALYVASEYTPYKDGQNFKPGSRLLLDAGIQRDWNGRHHVAGDLVVVYTTDDKIAGHAVFRDGMQVDLRLQGTLGIGSGSVEGGFRYILRGKDKLPAGSQGALESELNNRNGNDLRLHAGLRAPVAAGTHLWVSYDGKFLAANDYPKGNFFFEDAARIAGIGGGFDVAVSRHTQATFGARAWNGSSDGTMGFGKLDLKGIEIIQRLTVSL